MTDEGVSADLAGVAAQTVSTDGKRPPRLDSRALFQGAREAVIVHHGEEYRLRITRQHKLILTK